MLKYDKKHNFNGCCLLRYDLLDDSNAFSNKMNGYLIEDKLLEVSIFESKQSIPDVIPKDINIPISSIIRIENLLTIDILNDIIGFNDFYSDLKEECESYGKVNKYIIPKNKEHGGYGYVFVNYDNKIDAKKAFENLNNTEANGETVYILYYPDYLFDKEVYITIYYRYLEKIYSNSFI